MNKPYLDEPSQESVAAQRGPAVIEFGTNWCGYCKAAEPIIERAFANHPTMTHIKVEDGKGRPLGRSFRIKLWPTLVFMKDGVEVNRVVRPDDAESISDALDKIAPS